MLDPRKNAEAVAAHVGRHSLVQRRQCSDEARRRRFERDPVKWLRWYLPETYGRPFDNPHLEIIAGVMRAHDTGGRFVVAAERGIGKSAVMYGMVLFLALSRRRRFPVYLPWSESVMKRGLQFWRSALAYNERILADYPEVAAPFAHARGYAQRMQAQRWSDTGEPCGALLQVSDGMIVLPDGIGCIGGSTVNGNPRGLNLPLPSGAVLRPDLALVDDPQDRKVARSSTLAGETCAKIDGDVAGLGTAGAEFPILMSGNCVVADDVMARYLADTKWRALRISCVAAWPDGWSDKGVALRHWRDWWREYQGDAKAGVAYYKAHKAEMAAGMRLSAPHAYKAQKSRTLPDEFCVAMRQYWQMGHEAFMAERQQTPLSSDELAPFALTVELICSREDARAAHEVPGWVRRVVASTDINDYGLASVIVGYGNDQTAGVLWYGMLERGPGHGIMDANAPEPEKAKQLFDALVQAGEALSESPSHPAVWAIDGGYMGQVVRRYADTAGRRVGMQVVICRGLDGQRYRPGYKAIGRPREQCHLTEWPQIGVGLAWNTHYWREVMQRAWLGSVGRPGSCSLYRGHHRDFAEHIWRERMLGRSEVGGRTVWVFAAQPGRHDFGDALGQAYAVAAWGGIGTAGGLARPVVRREARRMCKVPIEE